MANVEQLLETEAGRIGPDIYRRTLNTSPWLKLVKQDAWPDEMGDTISVMVYERSLPDSQLTWSNVSSNDGTGNTCLPTPANIEFGQTLRQYNLQQAAIVSPDICVNDLRFAVKRQEQLSNIMQILTENSAYAWIDRYRDEYTRIATHKVIATTGLPEGSTAFPSTLPTSRLTPGILRNQYMRLIRDGGGNNPLDRENARPVFGLICSSETSYNIIMEDASLRNDFRYTTRVNELLAPLGIERSYNGFFHLIDDFAPRWDWDSVNNVWIRRYPYVSSAATHGNRWEIDPNYEAAAYEDSFIFHMDVYKSLIPAPITAPGGNTRFDPVVYRGDFKWRNIPNKDTNPDGTIGFFRGVFSSGSKPIFPQYGYVIRHLRCAADLEFAACS